MINNVKRTHPQKRNQHINRSTQQHIEDILPKYEGCRVTSRHVTSQLRQPLSLPLLKNVGVRMDKGVRINMGVKFSTLSEGSSTPSSVKHRALLSAVPSCLPTCLLFSLAASLPSFLPSFLPSCLLVCLSLLLPASLPSFSSSHLSA